jgi:hypothetical protein
MLIVDDEGEKHLGVCLGADTACLGVGGLMFIPTLSCADLLEDRLDAGINRGGVSAFSFP